MSYSEWEITVDKTNLQNKSSNEARGAFLGNGKIGFVTSFDKVGANKSFMSINSTIATNDELATVDNFNHTVVRFGYTPASKTMILEFKWQKMDMYVGINKSKFRLCNTANGFEFDVTYELFPIKNLPYCSIQNVTLVPMQNTSSLSMFHMLIGTESMQDIDYNNNTIFNEKLDDCVGVNVLCGSARIDDQTICVCSSYKFDQPNFDIVGFNKNNSDRK